MYWRLLHLGVIAGLVLAAAYVYDIKYQSTLRAERVSKLQQDLHREREAIARLRADWARLGNPRRIQGLAERHLALVPVQANQFTDFGNLPERPPQAPLGEGDPIASVLDDSAQTAMSTGSIDAGQMETKKP